MPFKAKNNREAVGVCAIHVVKRPSKRSVLVISIQRNKSVDVSRWTFGIYTESILSALEEFNVNEVFIYDIELIIW